MDKKHKIYLGLGSNMGNREEHLKKAINLIQEKIGPVTQVSKLYETAAWGMKEQADFLNQAIEIHSTKSAEKVLELVLSIEEKIGRVREEKWGARIIDIDILFFDDEVINTPLLKIPHPFIQERNFVLIPLLEICPDFEHPVLHLPVEELYWNSKDESEVLQLD